MIKMATVASQGGSRFANVRKKYSAKVTKPELDSDGRVKQVKYWLYFGFGTGVFWPLNSISSFRLYI